MECFSMKLNKCWESFLLLRPRCPDNSNFSDNSVQVLSSMHSNVQLLSLLLFFAVVLGVAVLIAQDP